METHLWLTAPISSNTERMERCWHLHQISMSASLHYPRWEQLSAMHSNSIQRALVVTGAANARGSISLPHYYQHDSWTRATVSPNVNSLAGTLRLRLHMILPFCITSLENCLWVLHWHATNTEMHISPHECTGNAHFTFYLIVTWQGICSWFTLDCIISKRLSVRIKNRVETLVLNIYNHDKKFRIIYLDA